MKLYIAGNDQAECQALEEMLTKLGHTITSNWLKAQFKRTHEHMEVERAAIATRDVVDVTMADALILCACKDKVPGGKFVEAGVALGQCKTIYVLGRRENMLLWHPNVKQFDHPDSLLEEFRKVD